MATDDTRRTGRLRRPLTALSRLSRLGDVPVVVMLAWAGWLAVPWSFSGLAQARAAAAAAAADAETPRLQTPAADQSQGAPPAVASQSATAAWGIPAARTAPVATVRPWPASPVAPAVGDAAPDLDGAGGLAGDTDAAFSGAGGLAVDTDAAFPGAGALGGIGRGGAPQVASGLDGVGAEAVLARERARIAGEVHDAAGHGLAAIAMQAGLALVTLDDDPEQARASLRAIKETSTTALAHLRAALDGIDPPTGDLAALIDGVRAAGLPVDVEPPVLAVPAHLHGPVYRVVRESLTNVLRHAGPTRALVRTSGDPHEFVVEVADRGIGPAGAGEGRGLAGMRAWVTEAGGHLTAGPREGGGFRVEARFPQVSA
ncbi:sensor histidine kinase [Nonomuraea sp. GTA35]|uniref:sensor histidine kinase n=1 Tax=Nonomuraea sp. GTA35 TaxID=1676746 RepID=UPI0035C03228